MSEDRIKRIRRRRNRALLALKHLRTAAARYAKLVKLLNRRIARLKQPSDNHLWGGSRQITNEVIAIVGSRAPITSRKRTETFGNPDSDHHVSQLTADAVDFGIANAQALMDEIARKLGGPSDVVDFQRFNVVRNGVTYRVQIIAVTHGTGPHLHVGVRRV